MGAYRTGKSFLLDVFLRYLKRDRSVEHSERKRGVEDLPLPDWLSSKGNLTEGTDGSDEAGFTWRPGMQKCTEGIWIWSQPFVEERPNADGEMEKVAVLLMDTQGAWDSCLSKEDSATIFGLTSVLSSRQVYNISKQIQEDKVENLHWFVECARSAMRSHEGETASEGGAAPFQSLEFLVRDWGNFEEEWGMAECCEQMREHLSQHCDPAKVTTATVKSLDSLFSEISCFCLPHPGLVIEKKAWGGNLEKLDCDFITFLDTYVKRTFDTLPIKQIMGHDLMPQNFAVIFKAFVKAFKDAKPVAMPIAEALAFSNNLQAKERGLKHYKGSMTAILKKSTTGKSPEDFEKDHKEVCAEVMKEFNKSANFGEAEQIKEARSELETEVKQLFTSFMEENQRRLEQALIAFGGVAFLGLFLFIIDFASNYICDWWFQPCVEISKMLFLAYMAIFGYIGFHITKLYKERGKLAATLAGYELGKECMKQGVSLAEKATELKKNPENWKKVLAGAIEDLGLDSLIPGGDDAESEPLLEKTSAQDKKDQ